MQKGDMAEGNSKSLSASIGAFFRGKKPSATPPVRRRAQSHRPRSKSFEALVDLERSSFDEPISPSDAKWTELSLVKSLSPVVACILPAVALDLVTSALLAIGATPIVIEGL